ncbi:MAG: restriction endonuclease subunit S [Actinomycetota bacterium]|nr:restriction endonuclease subunit S [Actinomycetota bacterium]
MDSLIGTVPDNWTERRLDEICEILAGPSKQVSPAGLGSADVPVVTPTDLRHNRIADDYATGLPREKARALSRYALLPDDIVCARSGHLGRQGLVSAHQGGWLLGSGCYRLRVSPLISAGYLVYYLGHPAVRDWLIRSVRGAMIPTLSTSMLGALPVVVPQADVQASAADVLGALDDKIIVHEQISQTTAALRDAVLLRLLSGPPQGDEFGPDGW